MVTHLPFFSFFFFLTFWWNYYYARGIISSECMSCDVHIWIEVTVDSRQCEKHVFRFWKISFLWFYFFLHCRNKTSSWLQHRESLEFISTHWVFLHFRFSILIWLHNISWNTKKWDHFESWLCKKYNFKREKEKICLRQRILHIPIRFIIIVALLVAVDNLVEYVMCWIINKWILCNFRIYTSRRRRLGLIG